ncbi:MAG: 4Fe-4S binding protein [Arenicellales bacterium]
MKTQTKRLLFRSGFFGLFLFAPVLDVFRFDLIENHFIILGFPWLLGTEAFISGDMTALQIAGNMMLKFLLPVLGLAGLGIFISWKWGRVYCGWLCPHFSIVETINGLVRRSSGKLSIWDKKRLPEQQQDGTQIKPNKNWWFVTGIVTLSFAFLWAVALLTYLLPPIEIYSNVWNLSLTRNQALFIGVATALFTIDFVFARHLFCRFGCAVGVFQSLVWMGNKKAMVVGFNRSQAKACVSCDTSCEHACPMHLKPRDIKRKMFTCTQCMQCVDACGKVQAQHQTISLLKMVEGDCALDVSARDFGQKPKQSKGCFEVK